MEQEKGFFLYKGLKKPLVFKGLAGKYIYYAAGSFGATLILSGILGSLLGTFKGLLVAVTVGGLSIFNTFRLQKKYGLYKKTKNNEIFIISPSMKLPTVKNPLAQREIKNGEVAKDTKNKKRKTFLSK